jgi:hypothetical protein
LIVIASGAKQSIERQSKSGLLRRFAPRNDGGFSWLTFEKRADGALPWMTVALTPR